MADAPKKDLPDTYGILTDEGIEKLRQRIGIQVNKPTPPHNYEVTWDGTRHFAFGYGDDNPLWCDPEYAAGTKYGAIVALPSFLFTTSRIACSPSRPPTWWAATSSRATRSRFGTPSRPTEERSECSQGTHMSLQPSSNVRRIH